VDSIYAGKASLEFMEKNNLEKKQFSAKDISRFEFESGRSFISISLTDSTKTFAKILNQGTLDLYLIRHGKSIRFLTYNSQTKARAFLNKPVKKRTTDNKPVEIHTYLRQLAYVSNTDIDVLKNRGLSFNILKIQGFVTNHNKTHPNEGITKKYIEKRLLHTSLMVGQALLKGSSFILAVSQMTELRDEKRNRGRYQSFFYSSRQYLTDGPVPSEQKHVDVAILPIGYKVYASSKLIKPYFHIEAGFHYFKSFYDLDRGPGIESWSLEEERAGITVRGGVGTWVDLKYVKLSAEIALARGPVALVGITF
jgi:hypothetical protein